MAGAMRIDFKGSRVYGATRKNFLVFSNILALVHEKNLGYTAAKIKSSFKLLTRKAFLMAPYMLSHVINFPQYLCCNFIENLSKNIEN